MQALWQVSPAKCAQIPWEGCLRKNTSLLVVGSNDSSSSSKVYYNIKASRVYVTKEYIWNEQKVIKKEIQLLYFF
jgi:hypothetical protein